MGEYADGTAFMRECLKLPDKYPALISKSDKARALRTLSNLISELRGDDEALKMKTALMEMNREIHGARSKEVAKDLHNIGYTYSDTG